MSRRYLRQRAKGFSYPFLPYAVKITGGAHKDRVGNVASIPWIGNLWNLWAQVNLDGREWVRVWAWQRRNL